MKQIEKMASESLLTSKPSKITDEKLWLIADSKIARDLGYKSTPPIHPLYFEHEKAIGDVFVSLAISGHLTGWDRSDRPKLRDDAQFYIDDNLFYLEVEMGNHGIDRLTEKVVRYKKYFRETGEPFHVLFVMKDDLAKIQNVFASERTTIHYKSCLLEEVVTNPRPIFGF
jgi:hypothetical protein